MRETIQNYFEKTKQYPNYYSNEDFSSICDDIKKFIPIGWLGYSGGYVLYEVSSHNIFLENMDVDGEVEDKPIANSLKELINNMNVLM